MTPWRNGAPIPRVAIAAALATVCASTATVAPVSANVDPEPDPGVVLPVAAIEAYVRAELDRLGVPGWALGIAQRGAVYHVATGGRADGDGTPVTPTTPFLIASLTKSFTAFGLLQLAEAGRLGLDDPVQAHLAEFDIADSEGASITIRHLLNQTSGIPRIAGLVRMYSSDPLPLHLERLRKVHLDRPVGDRFVYSNSNYLVAEALLSKVAGAPYHEYMAANVFGPLEMHHTFVGERAAVEASAGAAAGHRFWFGTPVQEDLGLEFGSLIFASAEDFARALIPHLSEGRYAGRTLLSPEGIATLHTPPDGSRYAMGWQEGEVAGVRTLRHSGAAATHRADMAIVPERGVGFVLLANAYHHMAHGDFRRIADGVTAMLIGQPAPVYEGETYSEQTQLLAIIIAMFIALPLLSLLLTGRWRRKLSEKVRSPRSFVIRVGLPAAFNILMPVALLLLVPWVIGTPLGILTRFIPDLSALLFVAMFLSVTVGLVRLVIGLRARPWQSPA